MKKLNKLSIIIGLVTLTLTSCGDVADEITSIIYDRNFAPVSLEAKSIGEEKATLDWTPSSGASSYTIEVYADDSLTFSGTPVQTLTGIADKDIPYQLTNLVYDTKYSARVMALDANDASRNSKWSEVYFRTSAQQIFNAMKTEDVADKTVFLSWPAGETVTTITVFGKDGSTIVTHQLTADEIAKGEVTLSGLSPETDYTAKLYNGTKERGSKSFKTIADLNGAITVRSSQDLKSIIESADADATIALYGGTYEIKDAEGITAATVAKNLTIKGIYPTDVPTLKGRFQISDGASLSISQVILDGSENITTDQAFNFITNGSVYNALEVKNCEIKGFGKGVFYLNTTSAVNDLTFDNCIIHSIECDGGDMFDCRKGYIKSFNMTNCTIYDSDAARDFIRMDDASSSFTDATPAIKVDHCTINGAANTSGKRLLYVRFVGNSISWTNNLVTNTVAYWSNQSKTSVPTFSNNAYYGCTNLNTVVEKVNLFNDESGTNLSASPYSGDISKGKFTLSDDVKTKGFGDPRWAK